VVLAAAGGAAGMWLGDTVSYQLLDQLPRLASGPRGASTLRVGGEVLFRGLGWLLLGLAIGLGEGLAAWSLDKLRFALIGGGLGGIAGGIGYGVLKLVWTEGASDIWGPALGLVLLGSAIGALSALVQGVLQPASVRVLRGWQEGREYPILKANTLLGRDERADIALFRDMHIEKRHAVIERREDRFILVNNNAPVEQTRVNNDPVPRRRELQNGDRIQLGNVVLRFQTREAQNKEKGKRRKEKA